MQFFGVSTVKFEQLNTSCGKLLKQYFYIRIKYHGLLLFYCCYLILGLDSEGLYRVSGVKSKIDFLKQQYNEGTSFMF